MHTLRKFSNISPLVEKIIFKNGSINTAHPRSIAKIFTSSINKNISDTFTKAVELSKKLPEAPGQEDLLKLYALFKQVCMFCVAASSSARQLVSEVSTL